MNILYALEIFPEISETFILDEMVEAIAQGMNVKIISTAYSRDKVSHKEALRLVSVTTYIKDLKTLQKYTATLLVMLSHPRRWLKFVKYLYGVEKYVRDTRNRLIEVCCLCSLARKWKIDHIHAHFGNIATSYAMWIHMLTGIPFTFTTHGYDVFFAMAKDMEQKTRLAKKHVTTSDFNKKYICEKLNIPQTEIERLYVGIDLTFFNEDKNTARTNMILHVARLHPVKGQKFLLEALHLLDQKGIDFVCRIVGDGDEERDLREAIDKYRLEDKCFLEGPKTKEEVLSYYKQAKLFVLSSLSEVVPSVIKEALACGVPVVATAVGGVAEAVTDGVTGYLVPAENPGRMADAISRVWADENLCRSMGQKGRKLVLEKFNLKNQVRTLIDLWKS